MIVTVASFKGGVGKTTTALHLAAYCQTLAPTLLVDGDLNRSALDWAKRGNLPFKVVMLGLMSGSMPPSEGQLSFCPRLL